MPALAIWAKLWVIGFIASFAIGAAIWHNTATTPVCRITKANETRLAWGWVGTVCTVGWTGVTISVGQIISGIAACAKVVCTAAVAVWRASSHYEEYDSNSYEYGLYHFKSFIEKPKV